MKLIYSNNKQIVKIGDKVTLSDGEEAVIESITPPHKPSSTGRVNVKTTDNFGGSYFPNVVGAEWIERQDQMLGLGSISHCTMRSRHLIPRFMAALESVDPDECIVIRDEYKGVFAMLDAGRDPEGNDTWGEDCNDLVNERLFDTLNQWVPPFTCFSSHPGDGADYGVWFCEESYKDAVKEGRILEIAHMDSWPETFEDGVEYVGLTFGNEVSALYDLHRQQIWSI